MCSVCICQQATVTISAMDEALHAQLSKQDGLQVHVLRQGLTQFTNGT